MAYTTINKSTDYFNTKLYTATGNDNLAITGVGFQPDLTWIKERSSTSSHAWWDAVRGVTKKIESDNNQVEGTDATGLKSFDSDGFTLGTSAQVNHSGVTNVAWNWKANGAGSANTDGSINSTVSANTTAGFSIVKYTGTGANATVGHGLGVAPKMVIIKRLENATHWLVGGGNIGWTKNLYLSTTSAAQTYNHFQDQSPSSSVVYMTNDAALNNSSEDYIMYCFAEKSGYSKFGSYVGNGSADGAFVYTGFKPSWVMLRQTSDTNQWFIFDNKRVTGAVNPQVLYLQANTSDAEGGSAANSYLDFTSNGFKFRENNGAFNDSGGSYIYMAFGQSLVGSNNIPCTAR